jgi:hypothetical protein
MQALESLITTNTTSHITDDWKAIDRTLQAIATRRAALDADEARWLRAAHRVQMWKHVGCVSMVDYMERFLGYGVRNAQERFRTALALASVPEIEAALSRGALSFCGVRALLRVATGENEGAWLAHCAGMNVHQIENEVSGRARGDRPNDPKKPDLELRELRYRDVRPSTAALEREAMALARKTHGTALDDDQFLATVFAVYLQSGDAAATAASEACEADGSGNELGATMASECDADGSANEGAKQIARAHGRADDGRARYQIGVIVCEQCKQGWRESLGRRFALDPTEVSRASCDAQHIGSLDAEQPQRATQEVPPRVRRLVMRRDGRRCTISGCRSTANLEVHHIVPREDGGRHEPSNLTMMCDACHANVHRGLITITGSAPGFVVTRAHVPDARDARTHGPDARAHGPDAHVCASRASAFDRVALDVDAKAALVQAGFSKSEAARAVSAARATRPGDLTLSELVRDALRACRSTA